MNRVMQIGGIVLIGACCVGLAVMLIGPSRYYCPQPSSKSVAALFEPCQAFDTAVGHAVTKQDAMQMGLLKSDGKSPGMEQPAPTPSRLIAQDFKTMAQEHATVGMTGPKQQR